MKLRARLISGLLVLLVITGAVLGSTIPASGAPSAQTSDPVIVGAGDISHCDQPETVATANLIESIDGTVFTLGDNAYTQGTIDQFNNCYGPTWGQFKDRTIPVPGNHDYKTKGAEGYFTYFGQAASPQDVLCTMDCKGYYSFNLGTWHIIVLNSEIDLQAGSDQEKWLRADLASNKSACTLAMWHEPLFSTGKHGNIERVAPFWQDLYQYGADVVLNGHDHTYQRFVPQDPQGNADPKGIREFVAGTGGEKLYPFTTENPNIEVRNNTSHGVLKLTLHPDSYDWQFIPIPGDTFTDLGASTCVTDHSNAVAVGTATPAPTPTLTPTSTVTAQGGIPQVPNPVANPVTGARPSWLEAIMAWIRQLLGAR